MTIQTINILEIIDAVLGTVFIILQNRSEEGSTFFASGGETFRLKKGLDTFLFVGTIIAIIVMLVLIYIDIKFV